MIPHPKQKFYQPKFELGTSEHKSNALPMIWKFPVNDFFTLSFWKRGSH